MDDDYGDDAELAAAFEAVENNHSGARQEPRLSNNAAVSARAKVQQPKPQALPTRAGPASILVSTRQRGNPILNCIKNVPWEYSDIPADYVLGTTTCALFLSLKYHRLHPEYIYNRIRGLQGKYSLRIVLTMVDIQNHEESLKELSKTSIINNVTIMLCWSAQEAGHYLELYKQYEHAAPTSIRAHQSNKYEDRLIEFVTAPRGINKTDAVGLISNFGSIRTAMNARPEEVALIAGWGEKKVERWCKTVREPFRVKKAAKRGVQGERAEASTRKTRPAVLDELDSAVAARLGIGAPIPVETDQQAPGPSDTSVADADRRPKRRITESASGWEPGADEEDIMRQMEAEELGITSPQLNAKSSRRAKEDEPSEGVMAALAKLRQKD